MPNAGLRVSRKSAVCEANSSGIPYRCAGAAHAAALLREESEIREGSPPTTLRDAIKREPTYEISADAFLLRVPNGLVLHYRRGEGVTASRPPHVAAGDVGLFLMGSVYGAIAWINGFIPLHASAVVHGGVVYALTAPAGYGKSTLAAALGQRGMPLFADDVLVLDLGDPSRIICLPGHKQLKLWGDALTLTGAQRGQAVREKMDKYYVAPSSGAPSEPLPLKHLTFLRTQARAPAKPVSLKGADRLTALVAALYRRHFCAAIVDHRSTFAVLARISAAIPVSVFDRPLDRATFDSGVDLMAEAIRSRGDA